MARINLTRKQQQYIISNRLKMSSGDLANHFGLSDGVVQRFLESKGLKLSKKQWIKIRVEKQKRVTTSDATTDYLLKELYLLMPVKTMADLIGRSGTFVDTRLRQLKLKQSRKLIDEIIEMFKIRPGTIPANKGKKQTEYMSPDAIKKTSATRFKKGHLPHNAVGFEDGDITIRHDHPGRGGFPYYYIRLSLGKWKPLHSYKWEQVHGAIPKGHCLWFIDGNPLNVELSNLELITRAENMKRNSCSLRLTDGYIAFCLCGKNNMHLYEEMLKNKELIEVKRQQLLLRRKIKEYVTTGN